MIYRVACQCGTTYNVEDRVIGKKFRCAHCRRRIRVAREDLRPVGIYRFACECGAVFRAEDRAIDGTFTCPKCRRRERVDPERLHPVGAGDDRLPHTLGSSIPIEPLRDA